MLPLINFSRFVFSAFVIIDLARNNKTLLGIITGIITLPLFPISAIVYPMIRPLLLPKKLSQPILCSKCGYSSKVAIKICPKCNNTLHIH